MSSFLLPGAIAALGASLYRTWLLIRGPRAAPQWCLALAGWSITIAMGFGIRRIYVGFDELTGVPNLARLVRHLAAVTCIFGLQLMYLYLDDVTRLRRAVAVRTAVWIAVCCAMVTFFRLAPLSVEEPDNFTEVYDTAPWVVPYMAVYLAFLAVGTADQIGRAKRYAAGAAGRKVVRLAGNTFAAGLAGAAVYIAFKALILIAAQFGYDLPISESAFISVLLSAAVCLVSFGTLAPVIGPWLITVRRWPQRRRLYQELHPLWLDLYQVAEHIALNPPTRPTRNEPVGRDPLGALYRRVIEIYDGMRSVGASTIDPSISEAARQRGATAGLEGAALDAVVQAAEIAVAIDAKKRGLTVGTSDGQPGTEDRNRGTTSTDGEAIRLARIAQAYVTSPVVASIRRDYAAELETRTAT